MDNRELLLSLQRALLGSIIEPLRAVMVGKEKAVITIKFIVERELSDLETEILDVVVTEILSDYPLVDVNSDIIINRERLNQLVGSNEHLAFLRYEK